jgi:predicted nucleic acid-binding protein
MRLVVDASVLVSELLRARGRARIADERLELFLAEHTLSEVRHELPRRVAAFVRHRGLDPDAGQTLVDSCLDAVTANLTTVPEVAYQPLHEEALWRCVRDPRDWPAVAVALSVNAAVWTEDGDFLGTGVATWSTRTLDTWLSRQPRTFSPP